MSIKLFALFKYAFPRRASLLLFFSCCFILSLLLCSNCKDIGNGRRRFGGNRPWTWFFIYDLAWKNLGTVIVKWTPSLFLFICQWWHVRSNASCSLEPLKIEIWARKASEIFLVHVCCTEVLFSLHTSSLVGRLYVFCDTQQIKKCDKIALQKSASPSRSPIFFLSRLLWSLVRSDKILTRRNTPVALVTLVDSFFAK